MSFSLDLYYKPNRILMSAIGLWPLQSATEKAFYFSIFIFFILTQGCLQVGGMIKAWCDVDIFLESIPPVTVDVMCFIKIINCTYNADKLKELLLLMEKDWKRIQAEDEQEILRSFGLDARKKTLIYAVWMYGTMVPFMVAPLIPIVQGLMSSDTMIPLNDTVRPLMFHVEYLVDVDKWYYYLLIHSYFATMAYITVVVVADSMYLVFAQHACSLLAIVGYVDMVESAYTMALFGQTSITMLCISFTGFQAVMKIDNPEESFRFLTFMIALVASLFISSYPPQCVTTQSEDLFNCIPPWYLTSFRTRRLLNLIILRSTYPCQLTAGSFYVLNYEYFSAVMRTSMSYLTMLCSFRE